MLHTEQRLVPTPYLERKEIQEQIEAVFYWDVQNALQDPRRGIPEQTRMLAKQAYDDIFLPNHEGYIDVRFVRFQGGPMMLPVMTLRTKDSLTIAVGFNIENTRLSTWLNQTLPEETLMTGIYTLAETATVLNEVLKRKNFTVLHRSAWPQAK